MLYIYTEKTSEKDCGGTDSYRRKTKLFKRLNGIFSQSILTYIWCMLLSCGNTSVTVSLFCTFF